ncbi:MAG TPA: hypothetical protein VIV40_05885 [Kofleriaceae bacterium]
MSLGRRIVQRATTRAFRRGIKVIIRKPEETPAGGDDAASTDSTSAPAGAQPQ